MSYCWLAICKEAQDASKMQPLTMTGISRMMQFFSILAWENHNIIISLLLMIGWGCFFTPAGPLYGQ